MNRKRWIFALLVLLLSSLACNAVTGGAQPTDTVVAPAPGGEADPTLPAVEEDTPEPAATAAPEKTPEDYQTEFPLPAQVSNFMDLGNGAVNFQTEVGLTETIAFYREAFAAAGYKEREINTSITDATFSLVFDGHASGKAIVLQGVDLGGSTNVNLRFEDL